MSTHALSPGGGERAVARTLRKPNGAAWLLDRDWSVPSVHSVGAVGAAFLREVSSGASSTAPGLTQRETKKGRRTVYPRGRASAERERCVTRFKLDLGAS